MTKLNMEPKIVWGQNIGRAIQENETVVIAFCVQWCGPCNVMRLEVLPKVIKTYGGPDPVSFFVAFSDLLCEHSVVRDTAKKFAVDEDHPAVGVYRNGKLLTMNKKCWGDARDQYEAICELITNALSNLPNDEEIAA